MATNENINVPGKKRKYGTGGSERDWDDELLESSKYFTELEARYDIYLLLFPTAFHNIRCTIFRSLITSPSFHPYLITTLQKWSNKVLAIAPSALLPSNATKFSRNTSSQIKSAVQLVDDAFLDRDKLVARTRVWRGKGSRLGGGQAPSLNENTENIVLSHSSDASTFIPDIFDDTDFYQSLLRDVISVRSESGTDAFLPDYSDWRELQQQRKRAKKASGAVDTRASKGRKLRFEVHEKLRNFMAPAPPPAGATVVWHEAQIDELFASVLGKGFGGENDAIEETEMPGMDVDVKEALRSGFRVFG